MTVKKCCARAAVAGPSRRKHCKHSVESTDDAAGVGQVHPGVVRTPHTSVVETTDYSNPLAAGILIDDSESSGDKLDSE